MEREKLELTLKDLEKSIKSIEQEPLVLRMPEPVSCAMRDVLENRLSIYDFMDMIEESKRRHE